MKCLSRYARRAHDSEYAKPGLHTLLSPDLFGSWLGFNPQSMPLSVFRRLDFESYRLSYSLDDSIRSLPRLLIALRIPVSPKMQRPVKSGTLSPRRLFHRLSKWMGRVYVKLPRHHIRDFFRGTCRLRAPSGTCSSGCWRDLILVLSDTLVPNRSPKSRLRINLVYIRFGLLRSLAHFIKYTTTDRISPI